MFGKRLIAMFLSVQAALALGLTVTVSWAVPAAAQAQKSAQELKAELDQLQIDMAALRARIAAFRPPNDYCGPRQRLRAPHQAQMREWEAEAERLHAASVVAARQLQDALRRQTGSQGRSGELVDVNVYARERNRLMAAVAEKRKALDRALAVPCPGTTGSIQSGGGAIGTTGQGAKPQPPQPPQPPPLPQPPTYEPVTMPVLPKFFCSDAEKLAFLVSISAESKKASDNATMAGMFKVSVESTIFKLEQAGEPVPPGLRAQEQRADAEARAHQAQFDALHRLHQQAAAIPVIDCSKSDQRTGAAPQTMPPQTAPPQTAPPQTAPPQTGMDQSDVRRTQGQQEWIAGIEADIAKLEPLRLAGKCTELYAEAELIRREISEMSRVAAQRSDGTSGLVLPPQLIAELRRRLAAATEPCPPKPQTAITDRDVQKVQTQQLIIGGIEAAIAELNALRLQGKCAEMLQAGAKLEDRISKLGHVIRERPDGSIGRAYPEQLINDLKRRAAEAMQPCPPANTAPRQTSSLPPPPPGSVEWRILDVHNKERSAVGVAPLQWDPALAASASAYAVKLAAGGPFVHAPRAGRENERENLSRGLPGASAERMMVNWTNEKSNFTPGTYPNVSKTGNWYDVSHYTQMIWPTTTRVGCGTAGGGRQEVLVCRYTPPGNRDGSPVLAQNTEVGRPDLPRLPMGGGMQQIDPPAPPPPPRPTAADDAPGGNEALHPLATLFAGALNRHYEALRNCDRAAAERALADMRYALDELRKRLKHARAVGGFSTVNPVELQRLIDALERVLRGAEQRGQPGTCPPR